MKKANNVIYSSRLGLLLQIPMWIISALGILSFLSTIFLSFTDSSGSNDSHFVGFENFITFFSDSKAELAISNTNTFFMVLIPLLLISAIIPALLTARLKLPFGILLLGFYSLVSLASTSVSFWNFMFSNSQYGYINSTQLELGLITQPIPWTFYSGGAILCTILLFVCTAPIFAITYIASRLKNKAVGLAAGLCSIPVLAVAASGYAVAFLGSPFSNDSIIWIPDIISNSLNVTSDKGYASAVTIIGILGFLLWCGAVCAAVFGISKLYRLFKINSIVKDIFGYIVFAVCIFFACNLLFTTFTVIFSGAFKPADELFLFPVEIFALKPTFSNINSVLELYAEYLPNISENFLNMALLFVIYLFVILPFSYSFAKFKMFKNKELLLLALIPLLMFLPDIRVYESSLLLQAEGFLSGISCITLIFVSYIVIKMLLHPSKYKTAKTVLTVCFILSAFVSVAAATLNLNTYNSWYSFHDILAKAQLITTGAYFAGELLLLLFTLASFILPTILLLVIFLIYKKDVKKEIRRG